MSQTLPNYGWVFGFPVFIRIVQIAGQPDTRENEGDFSCQLYSISYYDKNP